MNISIEKYVIDKTCCTDYELMGFLFIHSKNNMKDNILTYIKSSADNQWYFYNRSTRTKYNNIESIIKSNNIPYLLFYQKGKRYNLKSKEINTIKDNNQIKTVFKNEEIKISPKVIKTKINENNILNLNNIINQINHYKLNNISEHFGMISEKNSKQLIC